MYNVECTYADGVRGRPHPYLLGGGESVLFRELLSTANGLGQSPHPHWLTVLTPIQPVEPSAAREGNKDEAGG